MRNPRFAWFAIIMSFPALSFAQDRSQARSMVITTRGIVSTAQTLASQAGARILERGGSAVDAAIAANAVMSVVEPMMNGPGGDLFALYWDAKTDKLTGINASGWAPKALTLEYLTQRGMGSLSGIHAVTVPGCVDGWERMHKRFGRLPWKDLFQPAIYYAENGFPVTELIQWDWENSSSKVPNDDNAKRIFLPSGLAPKVGAIFRNPELGHAFRLIAELGAAAVYGGPVGEAILKTTQHYGGAMTAEDMREFQSEWVQPISTDYRGWKVYQLPPNGQGVGTLEMLNIMENFPVADYEQNSVDAFHLKIEAQKLATQDLRRYVADPRLADVPTAGLLSKPYAKQRASLIDPKKANCDVTPGQPEFGHGNTTYLTVVDKDGNIASWIQSISDIWGSGIAVEGMGFILHDRGGAFMLDPKHPNVLGPHKRPFHTIIPGFMERGSEHIGFGIMRGINQAQAQAQFVSNVVDHKMNIQAALEAPRFTKLTMGGCDLRIESRVPEAVRDELSRRGHELVVVADYSGWMGGGAAVLHDSATKVNYGASSPRKDGAAIPEADPYFK